MSTTKQTKNKDKKSLLISLSILASAFFICFGILFISGGLSLLASKAWHAVPKFPKFQALKELKKDQSNVEDVLSSQPKVSFSRKTKYVLVESSSMSCLTCANMYGYNGNKSEYDKLIRDFVESRKLDYTWIDNSTTGTVDKSKHSALYCVAEQSTKKFFEYKKSLYKNYKASFDIETAKKDVKSLGIDQKKFEDCINSKKYEERVNLLTQLSTELGTASNPTFYLYKVEDKEIETIDKKKEVRTVATLVGSIAGKTNYDIDIKPALDALLKE